MSSCFHKKMSGAATDTMSNVLYNCHCGVASFLVTTQKFLKQPTLFSRLCLWNVLIVLVRVCILYCLYVTEVLIVITTVLIFWRCARFPLFVNFSDLNTTGKHLFTETYLNIWSSKKQKMPGPNFTYRTEQWCV